MSSRPAEAVAPQTSAAGSLILPGLPGQSANLRYELSPDLVTMSETRPAEAEAIRTARTHIMARHLEDGRRGLSVTAATAGVGCSFVAANLAVALSQAGVSTLLIDGDMRRPQIDDFIRASAPTAGLKQYLSSERSAVSNYIHHEVLPALSIMYAGGVADDAQELLASENFRSLVERCLRDFEFTIIDTPAATGIADALRIASMVGYTLVVAKTHVSRSSEVANLAKQLQEDGAVVIGAVLNEI
jgi:capsular exopolysaccharide synthesis family protein